MKLRPLPAEETEGVMYYDPAATGERIQNLRKDREVTQEQLAKGCGVRNCTITAILRGQREPTIKTINKIAVCLNCSPSEIVEV